MPRRANAQRPIGGGIDGARARVAPAGARFALALAGGIALALGGVFVAMALRVLAVLPHDFDEGWLMVDAGLIHGGARPFVDFAHHELPLHLYLLDLSGQIFGRTVFGYRMLSLGSLAASGVTLFWLARPFVGALAALVAEAVFLFSSVQARALTAVPETPALLCTLVAIALLFTRAGRRSAWASGLAFVLAVTIKPTCLVVVAAAVLSLALAQEWRRLAHLAAAGGAAAIVVLAWVVHVSDGIFADVLRFQLTRVGTHSVGMWAIDSGFSDMKRLLGITTPRQWAVLNFKTFFLTRVETTPFAVFVLGLAAIPVWIFGCARACPPLRTFVVLWPAAFLVLDFLVMDFVSPRYFIPFFAFAALLCSGWVWLAERQVGAWATGTAALVACAALAGHLAMTLGSDADLWFWGRCNAIAEEHHRVVSFAPIFFAATGAEPGCELTNSALIYGSFGDNFLTTDRSRRFHVTDDRLIACLRAHPDLPVVVDWAFYFFTRPGSPLRAYLAGEGSAHRLFFSPEAVAQWDRPLLQMSPLR